MKRQLFASSKHFPRECLLPAKNNDLRRCVVSNVLLILAGVVMIAAVGWVAYKLSKKAQRAAPTTPAPADPFSQPTPIGGSLERLQAGDSISGLFDLTHGYELRTVRGTVRITQGKYCWTEHFLQSDDAKQYLSVEKSSGTVVSTLWTTVPMPQDVRPGVQSFEYKGVHYTLIEEGTAAYCTFGTTDLPDNGQVCYFDYKGADNTLLSFEKFDGEEWECSLGEAFTSLTVFPSST